MKGAFPVVGLALLLLTLVWACGHKEEPAQVQKPAVDQKAEAEKKPAETVALPKPEEKAGEKADINQALLAYLAKKGEDAKNMNPYQTGWIDLNGDGREDALVLLQNPYFCGSGGCTLLVFQGTPAGLEYVSRSTLIRSPVVVSETKTHGWRDIVVEVTGGGALPKKVALKFKGGTYPLNPSIQKALPKKQAVKGTKVF